MKKLLYILLVGNLFLACQKTDLPLYDTSQKDGVYLQSNNYSSTLGKDSIYVNFGFEPITESIVTTNLRLMGMPKDYDRKVLVSTKNTLNVEEGDENLVPALDEYYDVPAEMVIPANEVQVELPITLYRHADLTEKTAVVVVNIEGTEDLDIRGNDQFVVIFDDLAPEEPGWWNLNSLGHYSRDKAIKFYEIFHETEQTQKFTFDVIVDRWGYWLDQGNNSGNFSPLNVYSIFFKDNVLMPMYEYSQAHPELEWEIQKPNY